MFIILYSLITPIGIGIGWLIKKEDQVVIAIFMSTTGGALLYLGASEVVVEEFAFSKYKWWKFFLYCMAVLIMSTLWLAERGLND